MKSYKQIISHPYCCVACILEMILNEHSFFELNQIQIADFFGINVPPSYNGPITNITIVHDNNLLGMVLNTEDINDFFIKHNINLREKYYPVNTFEEWEFSDKIEMELPKSNLIVGYDYGYLNDLKSSNQIGHVSLIIDFDSKNETVKIYDPGPDNPGIKAVPISILFTAIKRKKNGLWRIS